MNMFCMRPWCMHTGKDILRIYAIHMCFELGANRAKYILYFFGKGVHSCKKI